MGSRWLILHWSCLGFPGVESIHSFCEYMHSVVVWTQTYTSYCFVVSTIYVHIFWVISNLNKGSTVPRMLLGYPQVISIQLTTHYTVQAILFTLIKLFANPALFWCESATSLLPLYHEKSRIWVFYEIAKNEGFRDCLLQWHTGCVVGKYPTR